MEIERKFIVASYFKPDDNAEIHILNQGYLCLGDKEEVRLRYDNRIIDEDREDPKYYLTVKKGSGLVRGEEEMEISSKLFETFWPLTRERRLTKIRYVQPNGVEVDIYRDNLAGLVVAEVEFKSLEEAEKYQPESWMLRDVTSDERYKNRSLAVKQTIPEFN